MGTRKSLNIILFGEVGVGKSSLVNLIAGRPVAQISSNIDPCTLFYRPYTFEVYGTVYTIWDTRGCSEAVTDAEGYLAAIEQAYKLIQELASSGGVDLLVLCHREGRITTTTRNNYRLFREVFCEGKVPIAIVVTHLERHTRMEDWWDENVKIFENHKMTAAAHACLTCLPAHSKSAESKQAIESMLGQHDEGGRYNMPHVEWFKRFSRRWAGLQNCPKGVKRRELEEYLRNRCGLGIRDAHEIARILRSGGQDSESPRRPFFGLF